MDPFEYFAGFSTFICTLALAHVLKGLSDLVEVRRRVRWDWAYVAFLLLMVPGVAVEWWIIFRWRHYQNWNFCYFIFLLIKPSLLYFIATLLVPRIAEVGTIDHWRICNPCAGRCSRCSRCSACTSCSTCLTRCSRAGRIS
jgi:hypothetical protein